MPLIRQSLLFFWSALFLIPFTVAVKREDFKQCAQASFCRRLRSIATKQEAAPRGTFYSPYSLSDATPTADSGSWKWPLKSSLHPQIAFELRVDILKQGGGIARLRIDEIGSSTPFKRYNETAKWALLNAEPNIDPTASLKTVGGKSVITYGTGSDCSIEIIHSPLKISYVRNGKPQIVFNDRSLFHMEHFRIKDVEAEPKALGEGEQTVLQSEEQDRSWFEESDADAYQETWKKWTDLKPKGPEGFAIDITFPGVQDVYGLPEHASPLSLPDTVGPNAHYSDPYRLYNVDIFEYLADSPMALYGSVPLLHAHSKSHTVGVLNLVGSDTFVDVRHDKDAVRTHWISESGILDLFFLPGPSPNDLFEQYATLTGPTSLPPQWSTAYHQCRWNYNDQEDVLEVNRRFDEADMPLDVTWLDIEYAEEHRYFDWDKKHFPEPTKMLDAVADKGRKMVAIVDPHIKKTNSFRVYNDAVDLDILIKKADGSNLEGWCWTGSSVWVDYFNPKSWTWWTRMFDFKTWKDSTNALFIWNDMNEPSVFDGPEISMPRDSIHMDGWEHRDLHNINGMMFHNQTAQALIKREEPAKRPFVLSRSFFAGSQRYGAIWTGDNMGEWEYLAGETAMFLSNAIAGMTFVGADVGGFFGNPSHELLVRWYQAGAFMPFFRAHAHIDTKRREPYLFEEPIQGYLRDMLKLRYSLLPVWYNAFKEASVWGRPIIRPQYAVFPKDEKGFKIEDQYYLGDEGLLVKPVTQEGATTTQVYISDNQPYYDYFTHHLFPSSPGSLLTLHTPLSTFPLLLRGGHIIPIRSRSRRSSTLMWQDPFTLIVAVGKEGKAKGQVYLDDGVGYGYVNGEYVWRSFVLENGVLKSIVHPATASPSHSNEATVAAYNPSNAFADTIAHVKVSQLIILGLAAKPKSIRISHGKELEFEWTDGKSAKGKREGKASELKVKAQLDVTSDWEIIFA
ncbi:uncharacterized protein L203_101775 [Cryptococcus depauperatus CBS 7841]|uniref:Glucosidase II subunit alpha n=1 Tax=Cryptococcus depauperatus CBS 7841 TaxID=1295531 RepID=A0A1E3IJC0_9TREE|nr:alpha 1,3-glucosidase [Cryptococcus depauperatus CBS 7841]